MLDQSQKLDAGDVGGEQPRPDASIGRESITKAHGFTCSEKKAFDLVVHGKPDAEIAQQLQISKLKARSLRRKIMRKLNVASRGEIAERARQWDLAVSALLGGPS